MNFQNFQIESVLKIYTYKITAWSATATGISNFFLPEINNENYQLIWTYRLMFKLLVPLGQTRTLLKLISNSSQQLYCKLYYKPTKACISIRHRHLEIHLGNTHQKCHKACDKIMQLKQAKSNLKSLFPIRKYFSYWSVHFCNVVDGPILPVLVLWATYTNIFCLMSVLKKLSRKKKL